MKQRILVIGCPGSGKTTFALRLAAKTGLPMFHMDWRADRTHLTREERADAPRLIWDSHCRGGVVPTARRASSGLIRRRCVWRVCGQGRANPS